MAMKQPNTGIIGHHIRDRHRAGQRRNDVAAHPVGGHYVAMPVDGMLVECVARVPDEIPSHASALTQGRHRHVPPSSPRGRALHVVDLDGVRQPRERCVAARELPRR